MADAATVGFATVFSILFAVIIALVIYLLIRSNKKNKKPKLKPQRAVSIKYGDSSPENGDVYPETKEDKDLLKTPVSSSSSSTNISQKPADSDSVVIEVSPSAPLYEDVPTAVVTVDQKAIPDEQNDFEPVKDVEDFEIGKTKGVFQASPDSGSSLDANKSEKTSSSSSSSSEEEERKEGENPVYAKVDRGKKRKKDDGKPIPKLRSVTVTDSARNSSPSSSSSSSSDESDSEIKKIIKKNDKKKITNYSSATSSTEEEIINHKKKKHRKRYIHNIEEVEIIEEHTFNKKKKKIYRKVPGTDEYVLVSASEEEEEHKKSPNYVTSKTKRNKKRSKEGRSSSSSSTSSDEDGARSPRSNSTYHTEYHFDVINEKDDNKTTKTYIETELSPTSRKTKHRTYKETIEENKTRDIDMAVKASSESDEDEQTLRSEKNIPISSTPKFKPFTATVAVENQQKVVEVSVSSSSSSSDSEDEDTRMRSEQNIPISSTPRFDPFAATVTIDKKKRNTSFSSSSSSESDHETRMRSETNVTIKSYTHEITPVTSEVFSKEARDQEDSSSSSSSEEEKRKSSSAEIRLKSPSRHRKRSSSTSSGSSDEKEAVLPRDQSSSDEDGTRTRRKKRSKSSTIVREEEITEQQFSPRTIVTTEETIITTTKKKIKKPRKDIHFTSGWKRQVTLEDLFKAGVVSETTIEQLEQGTIEQDEVAKAIHVYLVGEEPIAGLLMSDSGEKVSIYDAWKRGLIRRGTSISLLEAQAATGRIVDPRSAEKMSVGEATQKRLIDRQFEAVLLRAERAVYGYKTRLSNETLSLFEAMKRGLVVENHGIRLLEAQIATGGIIDPNANHRLPVEIAFERGLFDKRLNDILKDPSDDTRGFFDPNTEENLTYMELMERCVLDKDTGLRLLPFHSSSMKTPSRTSKVVFESANKRQVYLQDVIDAELIDLKTAQKFDNGQMTSEELSSMLAHLKIYVNGTMPIAGVINSVTGEKLSMIEGYRSGLLRKGTAFELLEAQAACGKIIDVQTAKAVSLETAIRIGVIDSEFEDCVSRAYRAVTGYREPFKREVLSLCEAMARHLVVQRHAIRLLEAQIATGGIIEMKSPVRISIPVAIKRGLLDHQLATKLNKKKTASYFDPVTGENLNYSELMGRCVLDKDSNLLFLLVEGGTVTQNVRPFEPEPDAMKIRNKTQAMLTTEVVETTQKKRSSTLERRISPLPESVPSSPPAILSRRVVIVDPNSGNELTVQEALEHKLIDEATAKQLLAQEGDFED